MHNSFNKFDKKSVNLFPLTDYTDNTDLIIEYVWDEKDKKDFRDLIGLG